MSIQVFEGDGIPHTTPCRVYDTRDDYMPWFGRYGQGNRGLWFSTRANADPFDHEADAWAALEEFYWVGGEPITPKDPRFEIRYA